MLQYFMGGGVDSISVTFYLRDLKKTNGYSFYIDNHESYDYNKG